MIPSLPLDGASRHTVGSVLTTNVQHVSETNLCWLLFRPVTGILVLEILVPRTKIFAGKYGPPLEKSSYRFEDARFRPSFSKIKRQQINEG